MQNSNMAILMKEARFNLNELFFSITKYDSTILSGNETFVRISGYKEDELLGQFHNIIRHEDMPRVVFKIFWDYLKANKPVAAYVKNKTKDGHYYWVFAVVFPLNDEFISIRIKPNTHIFAVVKELYFTLRKAEVKFDMQESEQLLLKSLNDLGYSDYNHFMTEILLAELLERKKLLLENRSLQDIEDRQNDMNLKSHSNIKSLYCKSKTLLDEYTKWFEKIDSFMHVKFLFEEKSLILRMLARDIVFLSLNASVASYKLDTNGETFGVLASDIRTKAKENDALIEVLYATSEHLSKSLNEIIAIVSYVSLQMEMVTFFLYELLREDSIEKNNSINSLYTLVSQYNEKLMELPCIIDKEIMRSISCLEELEQQVMYLGYVQIYGIIESSRCDDNRLGFKEIFSQLKALITKTSDEILVMKNMAQGFFTDNRKLIVESKEIEAMINALKKEIVKLDKTDYHA